MHSLAIQRLESALQARKFDHTLAKPWTIGSGAAEPPRSRVSTGFQRIDRELQGGWARGEVSEIVGTRSSGRSTLLAATLAAATGRGEVVGLVDAIDRFDPASAAAAGIDLSRVLWVRGQAITVEMGRGAMDRPVMTQAVLQAIRAIDLIVRAGGFGVAALDLSDLPPRVLAALPLATWMRLAHITEGRETVCLLAGDAPMSRSARGVSVRLRGSARWTGLSPHSRRFAGFEMRPELVSARAPEGPR